MNENSHDDQIVTVSDEIIVPITTSASEKSTYRIDDKTDSKDSPNPLSKTLSSRFEPDNNRRNNDRKRQHFDKNRHTNLYDRKNQRTRQYDFEGLRQMQQEMELGFLPAYSFPPNHQDLMNNPFNSPWMGPYNFPDPSMFSGQHFPFPPMLDFPMYPQGPPLSLPDDNSPPPLPVGPKPTFLHGPKVHENRLPISPDLPYPQLHQQLQSHHYTNPQQKLIPQRNEYQLNSQDMDFTNNGYITQHFPLQHEMNLTEPFLGNPDKNNNLGSTYVNKLHFQSNFSSTTQEQYPLPNPPPALPQHSHKQFNPYPYNQQVSGTASCLQISPSFS